jgi:hypothetical protein
MGIEFTCGWGGLYEGRIAQSTGYSDFLTVVKLLENRSHD